MAGSIKVSMALQVANPPATAAGASASFNSSIAGTGQIQNVQTIATGSVQALELGGVSTAAGGWFFLTNLDQTNFITIYTAASGGSPMLKLLPGESAMGRFVGAAPAAEADTGACLLQYLILPA
jgi:hypothetical protein